MHPQHSGVFVIVLNKKNQFLLGKRKASYKSGMYGFTGGRLELSETLIECAQRELEEEVGLKAQSLKYVGVVREQQDGYNFIHFAFTCNDYVGEPQLKEPDKCEGWNFYSLDKLPNNILPGHKAGLDIFIKKDSDDYRDLV
jgi:8-oxo-dGTP diphosphatase